MISSPAFRVLVTGSREFKSRAVVYRELNTVLDEYPRLIVVHGGCPTGADRFADEWREAVWEAGADVMVERHPADWGRLGRAAGSMRNAEMVRLGAGLVVAFFQSGAGNVGTGNCVKLARMAGVEVRGVWA